MIEVPMHSRYSCKKSRLTFLEVGGYLCYKGKHIEILRNILEEGSWGVRGRRMDFFTGKRRGQSREWQGHYKCGVRVPSDK